MSCWATLPAMNWRTLPLSRSWPGRIHRTFRQALPHAQWQSPGDAPGHVDERQRRLAAPPATDPAMLGSGPLIDVVCREPGFTEYPFTGRTVQLQRELTLHSRFERRRNEILRL